MSSTPTAIHPTRRQPLSFLGLIFIWLVLGGAPGLSAADQVSVSLIHLNDVYQLAPLANQPGGLAKAMQYVKQMRAESKFVLATFGGDALSPSVVSSEFKGRPMMDALGLAGIEVAVLGNHEFDFGPAVLRERLAESRFPWLAANMRESATGQVFPGTQAYFKRDFGAIRVCLIGLLTTTTPALSRTEGQVVFSDVIETASQTADELRKKESCHAVIGLTHLTLEEDRQLARTGKVDVILGGHDHYVVSEVVGKTPILKAGSDAQNVVVATLRFDDVTRRLESVDTKLVPLDGNVAEAPEMAALAKRYQEKLLVTLAERIGETAVALDARTATVRTRESGAGYLVADAFREALQADFALVNGGAMRADTVIPPGVLTKLDIKTLLPFENKVVKLALSGADLQTLLENLGVKPAGAPVGRFPHVAGMTLVFGAKPQGGKRPVQILVGERPLELSRTYTLAVSDYLAAGNGGYESLKNARRLTADDSAPIESEVVTAFVKKRQVLRYADERRLTFK